MTPEAFREAGHRLVDAIGGFLEKLPDGPVGPSESPTEVRRLLPTGGLPRQGTDPSALLAEAAPLLFDHSLFNGHPRFLGYITSSAAPIGALADLLAAAVNPNLGGWQLSPLASEIEGQTVRWIAEMLGYPPDCGGLLVSGGNMANFTCFLAGRRARADESIRAQGLQAAGARLMVYVSDETHTWIEKAADLFGHGTDSIRWIPTGADARIDLAALRRTIAEDRAAGHRPFMVVGSAGTVGTGAVDPLAELAAIAREESLWFHVDGAYGGFAVLADDAPEDLRAMRLADSIAVDPHKWLYTPLEAGCALVRDREALRDAFCYTPSYYRFDGEEADPRTNYFELGLQNSRGFRALKVWLGLRQVGREGYARMIGDEIALAEELFRRVGDEPELQACTRRLSITTFRYVPPGFGDGSEASEDYLNRLNERLLQRIKESGELFLSNAVVEGRFLLRTCIVNFRTSARDVAALPGTVVRLGRETHDELRPPHEGPAGI
jgi:glutamate/tyrosine decarboxylase-like PLP-dependent enzyme